MKHWFSDQAFRSILRNASYLGSSKLFGAGLGLIALACAGHAMSPAVFGTLVLIHAYATGVGGLVKFQTWQFIIQFGAPAHQRGERGRVEDTIRFAFGLDLVSGLVGMVGAMAALPLAGRWFDLQGEQLWFALAYCTLVPTMTAATPTGVLRLFDRFDRIAVQQVVTPALRATGAVLAWALDLGFAGFLVTWYLADLAGDLTFWAMTASELRRQDMTAALRLTPGPLATARALPGAWGFVWTTNLAHSVYAAWGPLSNLVVGAVLGPAAAGLFKIAATLCDSASKPADLLARGFYPEIMRLDPGTRRPWQLALRSGLLAGGVGLLVLLVVLLGGRELIGVVFGSKYLPAFALLQLMTGALIVSTATFPLESLLYMVGRQRGALVAQLIATALYGLLLTVLTHALGLTGAGIAYVLGVIATAACMTVPTIASYRERGAFARAATT